MKTLTIIYASGGKDEFGVTAEQANAARDALQGQQTAHPIQAGAATVFVNMRQVASVSIEDEEVGQPEPEAPAEDQPDTPQQLDFNDLNMDVLKDLLDKAGVDYPSTAKKADLVALAEQHLTTEDPAALHN